jgi:hypothetical protein
VSDEKSFWSWRGRYVGYRSSDCLFGPDGRQLGYFAEGDEVYGCAGDYLGEVRGDSRLITNLCKKAWTRKSVIPRFLKGSSSGHHDVNAKEMLAGYEDFPAPPERI